MKNIYLKISGSDTIFPYDRNEFIYEKHIETSQSFYNLNEYYTDDVLVSESIFRFVESMIPEHTYLQTPVEVNPVQSGSVYVQSFEIRELTEIEVSESMNEAWSIVRKKRDKLLSETDWTNLQDSPLNDTDLSKWREYRQLLRDITNQQSPFELEWPSIP